MTRPSRDRIIEIRQADYFEYAPNRGDVRDLLNEIDALVLENDKIKEHMEECVNAISSDAIAHLKKRAEKAEQERDGLRALLRGIINAYYEPEQIKRPPNFRELLEQAKGAIDDE